MTISLHHAHAIALFQEHFHHANPAHFLAGVLRDRHSPRRDAAREVEAARASYEEALKLARQT